MENVKTVKRSIRIPTELNDVLVNDAFSRKKTVNQVILEDLGQLRGMKIEERRRGRRWR